MPGCRADWCLGAGLWLADLRQTLGIQSEDAQLELTQETFHQNIKFLIDNSLSRLFVSQPTHSASTYTKVCMLPVQLAPIVLIGSIEPFPEVLEPLLELREPLIETVAGLANLSEGAVADAVSTISCCAMRTALVRLVGLWQLFALLDNDRTGKISGDKLQLAAEATHSPS